MNETKPTTPPLLSDEEIEKMFPTTIYIRSLRSDDKNYHIKRLAAIMIRDFYESRLTSDRQQSEREAKEFAEWCGFRQWYMSIMYNPAEWINIDPKIKEHWTTAELYQLFQQHKLSTNIEKK